MLRKLTNRARGRYEGRYASVTAKRWWSREDRRRARLAQRIVEYRFAEPEYQEAVAEAVTEAIVFGDGLVTHERLFNPAPNVSYPPYIRR